MQNTPMFNYAGTLAHTLKWHGRAIEIVRVIADPEDNTLLDAEAMPQFLVRCAESGEETTAYVDEVDELFWTEEMRAVIAGQEAFIAGNTDNPYTGEPARYFAFGVALAEIKGLRA